jgi:hypothetical protein
MPRDLGNAFDVDQDTSAADASAELFGVKDSFGKAKQARLKSLSIHNIRPDMMQPRRAIPSSIREIWDGQLDSFQDLLERWHKMAESELGTKIALHALLNASQDEVIECPENLPIATAYLSVVSLAINIRVHGLTNPITVVKDGGSHRVETGERRWIAHHLLNAHDPDAGFDKIVARVMDEFSVWRQASENSVRNDLNAIGKARQFSLLLMDLHGYDNFNARDASDRDQDFYAQVMDAKIWRIPRGTGEQLLNAMGVAHKSAFTRCRTILALPYQVWLLADDYNLPEDLLLELSKLPEDDAIAEARKVVSRNLSTKGLTPDEEPPTLSVPKWQQQIDRTFSPKRWKSMSPDERRDAYDYLQAMLRKMEEMGFDS